MIPIEKSDEKIVGRYVLSSYRMLKKKAFFEELNNFVYDQFCSVKRSDGSIIFENREGSMLKLLTLNYSDLRLIKDKIDCTVNRDFEIEQRIPLKVENVLELVYKYLTSNVLLECEEWYVKNKDVLTKEISKSFEVSKIITSYVSDRQLKKIRKAIQEDKVSNSDEIANLLNKFEDSKKYIDFLVDNIDENFKDNLDKFVRDSTKDGYGLSDFLRHTLKKHSGVNLFKNSDGIFYDKTDLKKYLIFKYKNEFSNIYDKIDKKKLVRITGVTVCPYCNRNFVNVTNEANTSQLDHFFPKSEYPLFALCFYNLIPSCYGCNNRKSGSDEDYIPKFTFKKRDQYIENFYQSNIENFSIIAGVNGTGKSSILNMLIHYEILYNKKAEYENLRYCLVFKGGNDICLEYSKYFCQDKTDAQIEIEENKTQFKLDRENRISRYITNDKYNFETRIGFLASEFDKNFTRSSSYDKNIKNGIFPRKYDSLYPINILRAYENLKKSDVIQSDLRLKLEIRWNKFSNIFENEEIARSNLYKKNKVSISQMKYFEKNMHKIIVENRGEFKNEAIYRVWESIDKLYREGMVSVDHYDNSGSQAFFTTYIVFNGIRNQKVFEDFLISYGD